MSTRPAAGRSESVPEKEVEEQRLHGVSEAVTSKFWQFANLIVPIILTAGLGFWISQKQESLKQEIDSQSQLFSHQMQLSEELYKRRFDAYDKLYAQLVQLNGRLEKEAGAEQGGFDKVSAEQFAQFNELLSLSKLHMGPKVEPLMFPAWIAGARGDGPLLSQSIHDLEAAMKTELDEWMLAEKEAPAATSTSTKPKKSKLKARSSQ
jgi:hypothetical protein